MNIFDFVKKMVWPSSSTVTIRLLHAQVIPEASQTYAGQIIQVGASTARILLGQGTAEIISGNPYEKEKWILK